MQSVDGSVYYQILPDFRVLSDGLPAYTNIRSLQTEAGPIVVKARTRR
ncbi:MAG: hypothetical protein PF693_02550 [Spirochaetia bacterium]|jgi:hypothetical protein|nr:hypothetical protein [Spirochaetia bacterium]